MQIARVFAALRRTELGHVNVISTARFAHRVHGLVNIADEMYQEFQRVNTVLPLRVPVSQYLLEHGDAVDYAVVVVLLRVRMLFIRAITIARLRKTSGIIWNIDKVPAVSLWAFALDLIRPNGNRGQIIVAQQFLHLQPRG